MYAYWLAAAGPQEATWLGFEMVARFKARTIEIAQAAAAEVLALADGESLAQAMAKLDRSLAYLLDRHKAALHTLERLAPIECPIDELLIEAERAHHRELAWAKSAMDLRVATLDLESLPQLPPRDLSEEEQLAAGLVPARQIRGPVPLGAHLRRLDQAARERWRQLVQARKDGAWYTLTTLALYWTDGARSILEIADLVELESGRRDVELILTHFQLLEKLGFVTFRQS
jgi:hypothetical protein